MGKANYNNYQISGITLILAFLLFFAFLTCNLAAHMYFIQARTLDGLYRWKGARTSYGKACKWCPLNTEFLTGYGDFLLRQANISRDPFYDLDKAQMFYKKALALNPRSAEYAVGLGKIKLSYLELYKKHAVVTEKENDIIKSVMVDFKRAIENDPNGFNTSYSIGYSSIPVLLKLEKDERQMALNALKRTLSSWPGYGKYIYKRLWEFTGDFDMLKYITPQSLAGNMILYMFIRSNGLWRFRMGQQARLDSLMKKELPETYQKKKKEKEDRIIEVCREYMQGNVIGWSGRSISGKLSYESGKMFSNGTAYRVLELPAGKADIILNIRGTQALDKWPYIIVELDDDVIGEMYVDNSEWGQYSFRVDTDGGLKVLGVSFMNDGRDPLTDEDRNVYLGDVRIE